MKREEHQRAKELSEQGFRYKAIARKISEEMGSTVSLRTLRRWKSQDGWYGGKDIRKYNYHPFGNQNARGHGAPIGNRNAWKHGLYDARNKKLLRYLRLSTMVTAEIEKKKEEERRKQEELIIEEYGSLEAFMEYRKQERWELLSDVVLLLQKRKINMDQYEAFYADFSEKYEADQLRKMHPAISGLLGNKHNRTNEG